MQISPDNPQFQTIIFGIIFCTALFFSIRKTERERFFSVSRTEELKGFAILAIILSHIGYFLSSDQRFLWPFSILAGVGVNLFLFLSGFGLTLSSLKKPLNIFKFYLKRLRKLFVPFWIVISAFFMADYFILNRSYSLEIIIQSFLGFFPVADLFLSLDSPLWYFSMILFYYLLFPLLFWKRFPYLCPLLLVIVSNYFLKNPPLEINNDVLNLYKLHYLSFPLGVFFALLISEGSLEAFKIGFKKVFFERNLKDLLILLFIILFAYTSINSGVGLSKDIEQTRSLITMFSIIFIFIAKSFEFKLFNIFGLLSYEIYLIHWPILARYDLFYKYFPASVATILYLGMFLALGMLLNKLTAKLKV